MQQSNIILGLLAPADQDATETVHPTVRPLHHPTSCLVACLAFHFLRFPLLGWDVGREAELLGDLHDLVISVAEIQAQPLWLLVRWLGTLDGDALDRLAHHLHVGSVGALDGQTHGDAFALGQQAALGALLGAVGGVFAGLFPPPAVPWSCTRPYSARTSQSPSSRRRPSGRSPTWRGRPLLSPSVGNGRGRSSRGKSGWHSEPSTDSRCVGRTGWPPCRRDRGWEACRRRRDACCAAGELARRWPATSHRECSTRPLPVVVPSQRLQRPLSCREPSAAAPRRCRRLGVIRIGSKEKVTSELAGKARLGSNPEVFTDQSTDPDPYGI